MIATWFNSPDRIAELDAATTRWLGTPWSANAAACGTRGGVSCHNLPRSLYIEAGFLTPDFPVMVGNPEVTRHSRVSVMEPWLDARPEFLRLAPGSVIQPGDLLGLRIFLCVDHLGIAGSGGKFCHVLQHKNTCRDSLIDPTWFTRILAVWRPVTD